MLAASIETLTILGFLLAALATIALIAVGWRKPAKALGRSLRDPFQGIEQPTITQEAPTDPYVPASVARRLWSAGAAGGMALILGAVVATVLGYGAAVFVIEVTSLLKR